MCKLYIHIHHPQLCTILQLCIGLPQRFVQYNFQMTPPLMLACQFWKNWQASIRGRDPWASKKCRPMIWLLYGLERYTLPKSSLGSWFCCRTIP